MNPIEVQVSGGQGIVPATYKTIVLKPNIVKGKNMLTQAMFAQTDTKYVIKYDYTIDDDIVTENVQVLSSNVSQCVNPAYTEALGAYNEAHDAWIDADNAYTNNPNDTTLAAKNAAYAAYTAAQTTLNNTPQYYYYAAKAINLHKGQHIIIPDNCILLNNSRNALAGFEIAPVDSIVYIGSLIPGTYEYTIQEAIKIPARCLIEFDGGSISNGTLVCDNTILVFDQDEEIVLKNVILLGEYTYPSANVADKKDNVNGMAKIYLKKNKSFATQLTKINTIYVIQHIFDLEDAEVIVPKNCVLEFNGGVIRNGTIIGDSTNITANQEQIFDAVTLKGSFDNSYIYVEWFGCNINNDAVSNKQALEYIINSAINISCNVYFSSKGEYLISNKIPFPSGTIDNLLDYKNITFYGTGYGTIIKGISRDGVVNPGDVFNFLHVKNVCIRDLSITAVQIPSDDHWGTNGISLIGSVENIIIERCNVYDLPLIWKDNGYGTLYPDGGKAFTLQSGSGLTYQKEIIVRNCRAQNVSFGVDYTCNNGNETSGERSVKFINNNIYDAYYGCNINIGGLTEESRIVPRNLEVINNFFFDCQVGIYGYPTYDCLIANNIIQQIKTIETHVTNDIFGMRLLGFKKCIVSNNIVILTNGTSYYKFEPYTKGATAQAQSEKFIFIGNTGRGSCSSYGVFVGVISNYRNYINIQDAVITDNLIIGSQLAKYHLEGLSDYDVYGRNVKKDFVFDNTDQFEYNTQFERIPDTVRTIIPNSNDDKPLNKFYVSGDGGTIVNDGEAYERSEVGENAAYLNLYRDIIFPVPANTYKIVCVYSSFNRGGNIMCTIQYELNGELASISKVLLAPSGDELVEGTIIKEIQLPTCIIKQFYITIYEAATITISDIRIVPSSSFNAGISTVKGLRIFNPQVVQYKFQTPQYNIGEMYIDGYGDLHVGIENPIRKYGNNTQRPGLAGYHRGCSYFDTTLNKQLDFSGTRWNEADGVFAGTKRSGAFTEKTAVPAYIYEGFMYMIDDGTKHFPIFAHINGDLIEWYKADGIQYTGE